MRKKPTKAESKKAQDFARPYSYFPLPASFYVSLMEEKAREISQDEGKRIQFQEAALQWAEQMESDLQPFADMVPEVLNGLRVGNPEPLFYCLMLWGPRILRDEEVLKEVEKWWFEKSTDKKAKENLRRIGVALSLEVSGRHGKLTEAQKKGVVEDCKRWLAVCQKLNKDLKRLWQEPAWRQASEEEREEIIDKLAGKHSLSVEEVKTAERYLRASSSRSAATPWAAMLELVAEKHGLAGC